MYRHCIYCSLELGANQTLSAFPVGSTIAFDATQGRLWAVCPACGRWNLSPMEERWEPVEQAERAFRDTRLRVQSEGIGLARLADGTRLIRVGEALEGELAAWRYGDQLIRRHRRAMVATGTVATGAGIALAGGVGAVGGLILLPVIPLAIYGPFMYEVMRGHWQKRTPFFRQSGGEDRPPVVLRRWHLHSARLVPAEDGSPGLEVQNASYADPQVRRDPEPLVLGGDATRAALGRGSVFLNPRGASGDRVSAALGLLEGAGSAERYIRGTAQAGRRLKKPLWFGGRSAVGVELNPAERLALEIGLHEEEERRALQGELSVLQAAWKEAEEIARIADRLAVTHGASGEG
jgi:hypothetical protein